MTPGGYYDEAFESAVLRGLDSVTKLVDSSRDDVRSSIKQSMDNALSLTTVQGQVISLKEGMTDLVKAIRTGNGQPSLMAQVNNMSTRLEILEQFRREDRQDIESLSKTVSDLAKTDRSGQWGYRVAVVGGIFGLVSVIITVASKVLLK